MFPSNIWNTGNDPISFYHDPSLFSHTKPYFLNETCDNIVINANTTPNSKQPILYLPSHFDEDDYDSLLLPHLTQSFAMRESHNNINILSTTDKAAHVGVSAEPKNNNINPTNDLQQHRYHHHQKEDLSDLRKNHIRYDYDDDDDDVRVQQKLIPRKKMMAKKDRHSKIMMTTGKRPRHRRMRLSLEVARQFFDLQDMLGYERASKTVEWLLIQARSEIKKLARNSSTASTAPPMTLAAGLQKIMNSSANSGTNSDCEVVSGLDEVAVTGDSSKSLGKEMKKRPMVSRPRCGFKRPRESRDKARERARERTKQKHMTGKRALLADHHQLDNNQDLTSHGLRSWSLEAGEEESGTHSYSGQNINSLEAAVLQASSAFTDHHQHEFEQPLTTWHNGQEQYRNPCTPPALNLVEECSFLNVGKYYWSPSPIFNYFQTTTNCGSSGSIPQEHQFLDFQFLG